MGDRKRIEVFDSTLRDGEQGEGISLTIEDKLRIVRELDALGIGYIEAGNPGSNPKDLAFFKELGSLRLTSAKLCAFGSTRRCGLAVGEDENVRSLAGAETPVVALFGKSWDLQVRRVLHTGLEENLRMIEETVAYFKAAGREVIFDAEHFFDGCASNAGYAMETLRVARRGGADVLCLCDTNGGTYTADLSRMTAEVTGAFGCRVAIHAHDDMGLAVANSMAAVDAGAVQVQGTFIGFGERCGNADLSTLIPNLQLKRGFECVPSASMRELTASARKIAEIANIPLPGSKPYVGASAFAHKAGMHIDAVTKLPCSFEHIRPEAVGNERRFLMSEMGGRATVLRLIHKVEPGLDKHSEQTARIVGRLKELEYEGYHFEGAQASVELLIRKTLGRYRPFFRLDHYKIIGEQPVRNPEECSTAVIKIRVGEKDEISAAQGDGPVHALDLALKKALSVFYPSLAKVRLTDYKVRVIEPQHATASKVRVLIESTDGREVWTTVGVSQDIINASWAALADAIEYKLTLDTEWGAGPARGKAKKDESPSEKG